jgi:hypothetical protein
MTAISQGRIERTRAGGLSRALAASGKHLAPRKAPAALSCGVLRKRILSLVERTPAVCSIEVLEKRVVLLQTLHRYGSSSSPCPLAYPRTKNTCGFTSCKAGSHWIWARGLTITCS